MYEGHPNPNATTPVEKMRIINLDNNNEELIVLYNPQSYTYNCSVTYSKVDKVGTENPDIQYQFGNGEELSFELFLDSLSAGNEVGGTSDERSQFAQNRMKTSLDNTIDVMQYTWKIYSLMEVKESVHRPPKLLVEWASLQFEGYLSSCQAQYTRFDEQGMPVRAVLNCKFIADFDFSNSVTKPRESPDTSKYRAARQGDSLWALSAKEYGEPGQWRQIAAANGIANPRQLRAGEMLVLPALD